MVKLEVQTRTTNGLICHHSILRRVVNKVISDKSVCKVSVYLGDHHTRFVRHINRVCLGGTNVLWVQYDDKDNIVNIWTQASMIVLFKSI